MSRGLTTLNHVNVVCADMDRSLAFYVGLLGLRPTFEVELSGEWIESISGLFGARARCVFVQPDGGGCRIELLQYLEPAGSQLAENALANTIGVRHLALDVPDLDGAYQRLRDAGVEFLSPPIAVPFRLMDNIQKRLCYCRDPDGVLVEICAHESVGVGRAAR